MSRLAVKFPAGEAKHLAKFIRSTGSVNLSPTNQRAMLAWVEHLEAGAVKLEPPEAKDLIALMSRICHPKGKQVAEYDAIIKRLQGGR